MKNTYKQKIEMAKKKGIYIPDSLLNDEKIVGIYKFFWVNGDTKFCFYIGKSTNIAERLLGSGNGHIYNFLKGNLSKTVPLKINTYLKKGYDICVEITPVNYSDTFFSKAAHRLAFEELKEIVKYQEMGECPFQVPEGAGTSVEKYWEKNYKIK